MSEARHDVEANALINEYTFGIVREDALGPIEEVRGNLLKDAIRDALEAAEHRGRIEGWTAARDFISHRPDAYYELHNRIIDIIALDRPASLSTAKGE